MRIAAAVAVAGLAGCWTGGAPPIAQPKTPAMSSAAPPADSGEPDPYRAQTIAADAIGVGLMTVGFVGLHDNFNSNLWGGVLVAGFATSAFAAPIIHLSHGRKGRAGGSYLVRSIGSMFGSFAGMAAACQNGLDALGECGVGRVFMGAAGGLALAGVVDAMFFHDDERPNAWAPMVAPTSGGTSFGLATRF